MKLYKIVLSCGSLIHVKTDDNTTVEDMLDMKIKSSIVPFDLYRLPTNVGPSEAVIIDMKYVAAISEHNQ